MSSYYVCRLTNSHFRWRHHQAYTGAVSATTEGVVCLFFFFFSFFITNSVTRTVLPLASLHVTVYQIAIYI